MSKLITSATLLFLIGMLGCKNVRPSELAGTWVMKESSRSLFVEFEADVSRVFPAQGLELSVGDGRIERQGAWQGFGVDAEDGGHGLMLALSRFSGLAGGDAKRADRMNGSVYASKAVVAPLRGAEMPDGRYPRVSLRSTLG